MRLIVNMLVMITLLHIVCTTVTADRVEYFFDDFTYWRPEWFCAVDYCNPSLVYGWIRFSPSQDPGTGDFYCTSSPPYRNLWVIPHPAGLPANNFALEAQILATFNWDYSQMGIIVYSDPDNYAKVGKLHLGSGCNKMQVYAEGFGISGQSDCNFATSQEIDDCSGMTEIIKLRVIPNGAGVTITGYLNGSSFGSITLSSWMNNPKVGLYCMGASGHPYENTGDVDWFRVMDNQPPQPTATLTPTITFSPTLTRTLSPTCSPTRTATKTPTLTSTFTPTYTQTLTKTQTATQTITLTPTLTPTLTRTATLTPTLTVTLTPTLTVTKTPTLTITPTRTPTMTPTYSPSRTQTPSVTLTATSTSTMTPSCTPTNPVTNTPEVSPSPGSTITPTIPDCNYLQILDVAGLTSDLVSVTVRLCTEVTITALQFDLQFDDTALHYMDGNYSVGELLNNTQWIVDDSLVTQNRVRFGAFSWNSSIPASSDGVLVTFQFRVDCELCEFGNTFPLELLNFRDDITAFTGIDGVFRYGCNAVKGDVNQNGILTVGDALLAFKIALLLLPDPTVCEMYLSNVNGDDEITVSDALCIFQEVLGIPNSCFNTDESRGGGTETNTSEGSILLLQEPESGDSQTVRCSVFVDTTHHLCDLQFDIGYNPEILRYQSYTTQKIQQWEVVADSRISDNVIRFGALDYRDEECVFGSNVKIVTFEFQVLENRTSPEGNYKLQLINPKGGLHNFKIMQ